MAIYMYDAENVEFKFSRLRRHLKSTKTHSIVSNTSRKRQKRLYSNNIVKTSSWFDPGVCFSNYVGLVTVPKEDRPDCTKYNFHHLIANDVSQDNEKTVCLFSLG